MVRSEVVDDIVQETFFKAWKARKSFKKDSNFKTWIYRIAMNSTYDNLNKMSRDNDYKSSLYIENETSINSDDKDLINKGLLALSVKHREVFILYYKMGYSLREISGLVGISEGTVKSRLHYAKDKFTVFIKTNEKNEACNGR
jgi:RNA polymerase sigma-70 factor (ECF subfamily)